MFTQRITVINDFKVLASKQKISSNDEYVALSINDKEKDLDQ